MLQKKKNDPILVHKLVHWIFSLTISCGSGWIRIDPTHPTDQTSGRSSSSGCRIRKRLGASEAARLWLKAWEEPWLFNSVTLSTLKRKQVWCWKHLETPVDSVDALGGFLLELSVNVLSFQRFALACVSREIKVRTVKDPRSAHTLAMIETQISTLKQE